MAKAGKNRKKKRPQLPTACTGPRCPKCDRRVPEHAEEEAARGNLYWCNRCHMFFDDDPEEGGSSHNDPVKTAMSKESYQARRKQQLRFG